MVGTLASPGANWEPIPGQTPIVSTAGFAGEGRLRRSRRRTVADVLGRYFAQVAGRPATLLDVPVAGDEAVRERLTPRGADAFGQLPAARLVRSGDLLRLDCADLLEQVLDPGEQPGWPEGVLSAQRVAIGGSRGALVRFARADGGEDIEVFTTRPDTLFGASFVAVSPSHPAARLAGPAQLDAFRTECARVGDDPDARVGVPLGLSVRNPLTPDRLLPVWLANFVVETYGTGAAGGCPACDHRDLDFARRYGLPVLSIVCPPGEDPATFRVGTRAHPGEGTIVNSGFLSGLPVPDAIDAAIARLVEVGRGRPTVQYRLRPLVVAEATPGDGDVRRLGESWRFTDQFLTAAALVVPPAGGPWRPHGLHVTAPEAATRHLLDTRLLLRALQDGREPGRQEPWVEIVLTGDVLDPSGRPSAQTPMPAEGDAFRVALLADTPPDRDLDWSDKRHPAAVRFVDGAARLFGPAGPAAPAENAAGIDAGRLVEKIARAATSLESALRRRRTNTAVAAIREVVAGAAESAAGAGLDPSAQALVGALLYPVLPDLAARGLAAAGAPTGTPPARPQVAGQAVESELVELVVQVNGKKRGIVRVSRDAGAEAVMSAVRADRALAVHLGDKPVRKAVVVPNRLVNLVL